MTNNTKVRLLRGYRQIAGFDNYAINRNGEIYNISTGNDVNAFDYDHWSGRVTLYRTVKGKSVKTTRNICSLIMDTYGLKTDKSIRSRLVNS